MGIISERLKELRDSKSLTQSEIADSVGLSRATYAMYEIGKSKPKPETLQKIADFYSVTVDYLLGSDNGNNKALKNFQTNNLAKRLKQIRIEKGKTQSNVSEMLGINKSTYSQYEHGKRTPKPQVLQKIADYYSVTVDYLLGSDVNTSNIKKIGKSTEKELAKMRMRILLNTQEDLIQNLSALIPEDKRGLYEKLSLCMDQIIVEEAKYLS